MGWGVQHALPPPQLALPPGVGSDKKLREWNLQIRRRAQMQPAARDGAMTKLGLLIEFEGFFCSRFGAGAKQPAAAAEPRPLCHTDTLTLFPRLHF